MKPFCSGGTDDLEAIRRIQGDELEASLLNVYYFDDPLAPAVAAAKAGKRVSIRRVLSAINRAAKQCECLLVEGAGGLLVPITVRWTIADLISTLDCEVVVVSRNKLGTLNHSLLTLESSRLRITRRPKVVFFRNRQPDLSSKENLSWIKKMSGNIGIFELPWMPGGGGTRIKKNSDAKFLKKTLARICDPDNVCPVVRTAETKRRNERLKNEK